MSTVSDDDILSYLEGEADDETIEAVELAIKTDPEVEKTAELMRLSKEMVQEELKDYFEPPADLLAQLKSAEDKQADLKINQSTKRFLFWRPVAKAANSNQFKMLVAACFALVFVVSQDVVQIAEQPWQGKVLINSSENKSVPKTRSSINQNIPIKEISFTSTADKSVKLVIGIYDVQKPKIQLSNDVDFILYKNWFKTLTGYFGLVPGNVVKIGIGQSIQLSVTSMQQGKVSLKAVQDNGLAYSFFDKIDTSKNQILITQKMTAEAPTDTGRFILEFTPDDEEIISLIVPFELVQTAK